MNEYLNSYLETFKKYAVFSGRASRKEYWTFVLINFIISLILSYTIKGLGNIFQLTILLPTIAVAIRRMHDVDKSGWFLLIPIYNFILAITSGTTGKNQYDPAPTK
jgi:uncharacterized membrane protein YhaH (DUF805 family)